MFSAVLVANRGEIALRIIRTLRAMGIRSVAVYTDPDRDAAHVEAADLAVGIGPAAAYLDGERIVEAAAASGVSAVHPGYGFLSENARFARTCEAAGLVFVGPPADAIELMGDKINAKRAVVAAGVPTVPGLGEPGLSDAQLAAGAVEIGLPVLFKPAAGGGGKGMRLVTERADLAGSIAAARREAVGAFGDDTLLVERYVGHPRHIEIQVFADAFGQVCSLGERECSLQRRHQKIVEETPSVLLDDQTRAAMAAAATAAARACGYVNAGTVEFIMSADRPDEFFFMEMNTRLQVEHPVTEAVLGLDLVEWQLRVAAGERLPWAAAGPEPQGHAVEARVYAEDPGRGFLPATGTVLRLAEPSARPHIRVDSALRQGTVVGTSYDPMLAKVVAWGPDRTEALARLGGALAATEILGVTTNVGFLRRLLAHPDVTAGRLHTELVERIAAELLPPPAPDDVVAAAALLSGLLARAAGPNTDPWNRLDGWRIAGAAPLTTEWEVAGELIPAAVEDGAVRVGTGELRPVESRLVNGDLVVETAGVARRFSYARDDPDLWLGQSGDTWRLTRRRDRIDHAGPAETGSGRLTSPMPGTVLAVHVGSGETVRSGQPVITVEAMKMEYVVAAPHAGTVTELFVKPGEAVRLDQPLAAITPPEEVR
jgi:acetyl-CoA/propionyl-CoA carboxylase biotin carboxyl carrier protein